MTYIAPIRLPATFPNMGTKTFNHPSCLIRKHLNERKWSQNKLALASGIPPNRVGEILNRKRRVTPFLALKLENALGIEAEAFLSLQSEWDLAQRIAKARGNDMTWEDDERHIIASDLEGRAKAIEDMAIGLESYERYCRPRHGVELYQEAKLLREVAFKLIAKAKLLRKKGKDV